VNRWRRRLRFARSIGAKIGLGLLAFVLGVALLGPFFAPNPPDAVLGAPYMDPSSAALLGTDQIGRDVLSRVLWGGRSVIALAAAATALAYAVGLAIGLIAGYTRSWFDQVLMRGVDVILAFPGLILILLLITGLGSGHVALVGAVAILQAPGIARVIRTATLEQSVRGFVEAAVARGESTLAILRREILPNIVGPISAEIGLRFTFSILIIAAVNFLGLGLEPPAADWGLMVSENRQGIALNPWTILVPAVLIGLLTISLNLIADSVARSQGRS
jgi:ABC-type dipeptide/oligopeptide/nickel transport system permease subunit